MLQSRNEGDKSNALAFFLLNTENFPDSFNAFDSLGEAYEVAGDKENAIDRACIRAGYTGCRSCSSSELAAVALVKIVENYRRCKNCFDFVEGPSVLKTCKLFA